MNFANVKQAALASFLDRSQVAVPDGVPMRVYENPTEDILEQQAKGPAVSLHAAGAAKPARRLEENYLYATRRFPNFAAGETTLTLGVQDYRFFATPIGGNAVDVGFPALVGNLTELETNIDTAGQVPYGKNFVLRELGVSFNADATTADVGTLMEAGALRFTKQGDQYSLRHGPVRMWPGGTGISGFAASSVYTTASVRIEAAHNGSADVRAVRRLKVARVIRSKEVFAYIYTVPRSMRNTMLNTTTTAMTLGVPVVMTIWLWGGVLDYLPS